MRSSVDRAVAQRGQDLPVDRDPAKGRHLLGDGQPGQLVPEVHLVRRSSAAARAPAARRSPPARRRERLRATRTSARAPASATTVHHLLRGRDSRAVRESTASRTVVGNFCGAGRQRLGDEERIARRSPGRDARYPRRPRRDGIARGPRPVPGPPSATAPAGRVAAFRSPWPRPRHDPERMAGGHLLGPIGHQHQRMAAVHATTQVPDEVQGRFVGPVRVLDDEQIRLSLPRLPQGRQQPGEHS